MPESDLAKALGRIPSGLFILTARHEGQETGMLASWVMQAGFEPPAVSVAVRKGRFVAQWLAAGAPFALNVVPQGDSVLLKHFSRGFEPGENAFDGLQLHRSASGVPLLGAALAVLECSPIGSVDSGDHRVFLASVTAASVQQSAEPRVHIRTNGLRY